MLNIYRNNFNEHVLKKNELGTLSLSQSEMIDSNPKSNCSNLFDNIFKMVDNGLLIFNSNATCIFNNMANYFKRHQKSQAHEFLNYDIINKVENRHEKLSIDKIFKLKNSFDLYLVSDFSNFQNLLGIFNYVYKNNTQKNISLENMRITIDRLKSKLSDYCSNDVSDYSKKLEKLPVSIKLADLLGLMKGF